MDIMMVPQADQDLEKLIENVIMDVEPMVLCNRRGQKAVLMGLDEFNAWQETFYLLSNPANAEHLMRSLREIDAGETVVKDSDEL